MTFPLRPERVFNRDSGAYRGYPVWSYQSGLNTGDRQDATRHICVGIPAPMAPFSIRCGPIEFRREGSVAIGYPPFDRMFSVYSQDARIIRATLTPQLVNWLLATGWDNRRTEGTLPDEIQVGSDHAQMWWDKLTRSSQAQAIVDFLIDFLLRTPPEIWPAPLPGMVGST